MEGGVRRAISVPVRLARRGRRAARRQGATPRTPGFTWEAACYAPHSSIYFDQMGKARACCQTDGVFMGDVTQQSLREIWDSAESERMRAALEDDDYGAGCDFCAWQVREGNDDILFSKQYDYLRPVEHRPTWPRQMEFALTNTCNLQCSMCNGDWSSMIRSRREQRPPLPISYGEAFFEQLAEFLPHLEFAKFAGGEPFLGAEPLRVMEMLADQDPVPEVTIISNGTQWNSRVKRIVERLRPKIIMSIDGASTETYDAIRVGAHFPDVIANLDHLLALLGPSKLDITTCLMTNNWHEFADVLLLAEERGLGIGVNVVRFPAAFSLYQLEADDLGPIVEAMEARHVELTGARLDAWNHHRRALRHRLEAIRADQGQLGAAHGLPGAPDVDLDTRTPVLLRARRGGDVGSAPSSRWPWLPFPEQRLDARPVDLLEPGTDSVRFAIDREGTLHVRESSGTPPVGIADLDGAHVDALQERLAAAFPDQGGWSYGVRRGGDDDDRLVLWFAGSGAREQPLAVMWATAERDEDGQLVGAQFVIEASTEPVAPSVADHWSLRTTG